MQKSLVLMNIKVDTVISDILGKSGKTIIEAILEGNHDPHSEEYHHLFCIMRCIR